ncbi:hypothetical protein N7494_005315 [Penicillium frequentans]|uniref:HTH psq-type domain-containing protein n=1 Tax=Penicillium frequentans TaxID=3151616 RepID=A0AAD6GHE0_9EURO|nr:hypothetical protein N7494_005315 [Penicillium glabrum]
MPQKAPNEEDLLRIALAAYNDKKFSSLRKAADHYHVSYSNLRGRKNGLQSLSDRPSHNKAVNADQEKALLS